MDDKSRITRVETEMDSMRESITRLENAVAHLHGDLEGLRTYVERGFERQRDEFEKVRDRIDENRERFENKLADERSWAEGNFKDLRTTMENGFAECRAEAKVTRRWLISIAVSIALGLAGIAAKFLFIA